MKFDKSKLYSPDLKKQEGHPVVIAKIVIEMIIEDKIQDARSILEYIRPEDNLSIENIAKSIVLILEGELQSEVLKSQNLEVSRQHRLLSSKPTPELVAQISESERNYDKVAIRATTRTAYSEAYIDKIISTRVTAL